jgi:hypothetical protein
MKSQLAWNVLRQLVIHQVDKEFLFKVKQNSWEAQPDVTSVDVLGIEFVKKGWIQPLTGMCWLSDCKYYVGHTYFNKGEDYTVLYFLVIGEFMNF